MPHTITYSDSGVDLKKFLTQTYSGGWSPPLSLGYFHQSVEGFGNANRYFANTNEPRTLTNGFFSFLPFDSLQKGNLSGDRAHLGFVVEAPEGQKLERAFKHLYDESYYGPIAKITVGWGVEAIAPDKFIVQEPALTFDFEELEATGLHSEGDTLIKAFNKGNFNVLFQNNTDDTTQIAGFGKDVMYGFAGTDVFVFPTKYIGKDTIRNFEANDDHDIIRLSTDIYKNWDELKPNISMQGTNTVIRIDNLNEIKIGHVNQRHIGEADFEFVSPERLALERHSQHKRSPGGEESFEYRVDTPHETHDMTHNPDTVFSLVEMQPA